MFMRFNKYNLIEAIKNNDTNQINFILKGKKANINDKDKDGWTALIWASYEGHLGVVQYLADNGANINDKDNDGWTALMRASWRGYSEIVKYLIEIGADINIKNDKGETALDLADTEEIKEIFRKAGDK